MKYEKRNKVWSIYMGYTKRKKRCREENKEIHIYDYRIEKSTTGKLLAVGFGIGLVDGFRSLLLGLVLGSVILCQLLIVLGDKAYLGAEDVAIDLVDDGLDVVLLAISGRTKPRTQSDVPRRNHRACWTCPAAWCLFQTQCS